MRIEEEDIGDELIADASSQTENLTETPPVGKNKPNIKSTEYGGFFLQKNHDVFKINQYKINRNSSISDENSKSKDEKKRKLDELLDEKIKIMMDEKIKKLTDELLDGKIILIFPSNNSSNFLFFSSLDLEFSSEIEEFLLILY